MLYYRRIGVRKWRELSQEEFDQSLQAAQEIENIPSRVQFARVAQRPVIVRIWEDYIIVFDARTDYVVFELPNTSEGRTRLQSYIVVHNWEVVSTDM